VTKLQLDSRREEFTQEIRHQQEEARRDRVVEARKGYLVPLRDKLIAWLDATVDISGALAQLQIAVETQGGTGEYQRLAQGLAVQVESGQMRGSELARYLAQVSDATLVTLLMEASSAEAERFPQVLERVRSAHRLGAASASGNADLESLDAELQKWTATITSIVTEREKRLLAVSKRIEQLLAGDESA